jgi:hypothetical protein
MNRYNSIIKYVCALVVHGVSNINPLNLPTCKEDPSKGNIIEQIVKPTLMEQKSYIITEALYSNIKANKSVVF